MSRYAASLVVATRNRLLELRELLVSAMTQSVPLEILVMDDGASDDVASMVRSEFPKARYFRLGVGLGPSFQRNRGIELATGPVVFPLDDDTCMVSTRSVEQTLAEFDHPRVAAVAIPFVNVLVDKEIRQRAPSATDRWIVHSYVGAAHAIRRAHFLALGGYRETYFYMGEEGDLSVRMLAHGLVVRAGLADAIHHFESPRRNLALADYYGRRNDVLFCWYNVPASKLLVHTIGTVLKGMLTAARSRNPSRMLAGLRDGLMALPNALSDRKPVPLAIYRIHRSLKKDGPKKLSEIDHVLPPL